MKMILKKKTILLIKYLKYRHIRKKSQNSFFRKEMLYLVKSVLNSFEIERLFYMNPFLIKFLFFSEIKLLFKYFLLVLIQLWKKYRHKLLYLNYYSTLCKLFLQRKYVYFLISKI